MMLAWNILSGEATLWPSKERGGNQKLCIGNAGPCPASQGLGVLCPAFHSSARQQRCGNAPLSQLCLHHVDFHSKTTKINIH